MYDGLGRMIARYVGYDVDETSYADAGTIDGDTILEQSLTAYDQASTVIQVTQTQRYHDASASQTGALNGPGGPAPKGRITYSAQWPDGVGRIVTTADYGTNGGSALTRPSVAPARSDTVLVSTTAFDDAGRVFSQIDPAGMETRISYDDAGRRTQVIENVQEASGGGSSSSTSSSGDDCEPSTDANRTTDFTYTADGQLATLTAWNAETGNQTTTYTYGTTLSDSDVASSLLLRTTKYPDSPGTGGTDVVTLAYNRQGERKQLTDQRGCVHQYVYDGLGRPIHDRVTTLGTNVDGAVLRLSTTYEIRGGIASQSSYDSATVGSGSIVNQVAFRYNDFVQRYESWQSHSGAVNFTSTPKVVSAYADGSSNTIRPTSLTYPNGREIASDYGTSGGMEDCVSRVASLIDDDSTILADYEYLGLGAVVSDICLETGVSYTLIDPTGGTDPDTGDIYGGLDRFSRVKDVRWRKSGSDVSRVQYGYDRASNRTWRRNPSDSGNHYDWLYSYDGLHRLKHADRGTLDGGHTSIGSPQFAQCWTLDETGNWSGLRQSDSGSSWSLVQSRISNAANEISSIGNSTGGPWTSPSYDAAGNMLHIPEPASPVSGYWATYDAWNRLVTLKSGSQTVQENEYDARNYRTVRKSYTSGSLTETRHAYYSDGWQVLEERIGSSTTPDRHFVWGLRYIDDLILRDRTTSGTLDERLYSLQDGNWNVTAVADDSGTVQERYEYDPYGLTTVLTPSFGSRGTSSFEWETTYAGYRWDAGTGLFAVRNRYFHPRLGAWVTRDPVATLSRQYYRYGLSSPLGSVDPTGLQDEFTLGTSVHTYGYGGAFAPSDSFVLRTDFSPSGSFQPYKNGFSANGFASASQMVYGTKSTAYIPVSTNPLGAQGFRGSRYFVDLDTVRQTGGEYIPPNELRQLVLDDPDIPRTSKLRWTKVQSPDWYRGITNPFGNVHPSSTVTNIWQCIRGGEQEGAIRGPIPGSAVYSGRYGYSLRAFTGISRGAGAVGAVGSGYSIAGAAGQSYDAGTPLPVIEELNAQGGGWGSAMYGAAAGARLGAKRGPWGAAAGAVGGGAIGGICGENAVRMMDDSTDAMGYTEGFNPHFFYGHFGGARP